MKQNITGFRQDDEGDWVAELSCGHNQHVRHNPPFIQRPWVLTPEGRAERLGTPLTCPLCDKGEFPETIRWARSSPEWDERTLPPGLLRAHRLAAGTWGKLTVHHGSLLFSFAPVDGDPPLGVELGPGSPAQPIPPEAHHEVKPLGQVRFAIDFYTVDREANADRQGNPKEPPSPAGEDGS